MYNTTIKEYCAHKLVFGLGTLSGVSRNGAKVREALERTVSGALNEFVNLRLTTQSTETSGLK